MMNVSTLVRENYMHAHERLATRTSNIVEAHKKEAVLTWCSVYIEESVCNNIGSVFPTYIHVA